MAKKVEPLKVEKPEVVNTKPEEVNQPEAEPVKVEKPEVEVKIETPKKVENKMIRFGELEAFRDAIMTSNISVTVRIGDKNSPSVVEVPLNSVAREIKANFS